MRKETIGSRETSRLPSSSRFGLPRQRSRAWRRNRCSRSWIRSVPTACLRAELVRREHHGVLVVAGPRVALGHPDRHVRRGGRVVPDRQRAVAVQQGGRPVGVGQDAGHIRGGREAPHDQRPPGQVELAVGVLADGHHLGGRLGPGQQVGVVLERPHQHHRPRAGPGGPSPPAELQQADQLGHRRRGPGPAEDDQVLAGAADRLVDDLAGLLAQPGGVAAGARALGVGVGVPGQDLATDGVLDEATARPEAVQSA
jgi:hypothetical protein